MDQQWMQRAMEFAYDYRQARGAAVAMAYDILHTHMSMAAKTEPSLDDERAAILDAQIAADEAWQREVRA